MVELDCETRRVDSATLVTLEVVSEEPTHVRVENGLDGPVWPPRRRGVPAAGWDEDGFEGVVDGRIALGYASPAEPADPAARITEQRPPSDDESVTPAALVREYGPGTPPQSVVGVTPSPVESSADATDSDGASAGELPPAVTAWLETVEGRIDDAEELSAATSLEAATDAVAAAGGPDAVGTVRDQVAADREQLRALARQCERLADRAETVEVPVETLARLA